MGEIDRCDVCGEDVGQRNTRVRVLGLYRRRVCDSCDEKYSKIQQRKKANELDARTCGFCDTEFDSSYEKQKHQKNECEKMPRTRTSAPDQEDGN